MSMCPITHFSFVALGLSVVASFILGSIWYGPLFGKKWAELAGVKMDQPCCGKPPASALIVTFLGNVLTVVALAYIIGNGQFPCAPSAAFLVWIGFYVPLMLGSVTWERRPWKLFLINVAYAFVNLHLVALILMYLK